MALSEATKEIKLIIQVLLSIGIEVEMPVIVCVDKVSTNPRAMHVDVCYYFARESIEDGFIQF